MTDALVARMKVIAEVLQSHDRIGEADRRWLQARIHNRDWMDSDRRLLSEMLPRSLRCWMLDDQADEPGQSDG